MLEPDAFRGVVVFAANLAGDYDDVLVRRIASRVRFGPPDLGLRRCLWRTHLPDALPRAPEATPEGLAELTAGSPRRRGDGRLQRVVVGVGAVKVRPAVRPPARRLRIGNVALPLEIARAAA